MIRIGILGSDNSHALAFSKLCNIPDENGIYAYEDVRVTAIYGKDDDPEHTKEVAREGKVEFIANSPEEFFGKVDAVMVVYRKGSYHVPDILPFIEKGYPVWIDKPIAASSDDIELLKAAYEKHNALVTGGSTMKYNYEVQTIQNRMKEDKFGKVYGGSITFSIDMDEKYDGIYFYSSHLVEMVLSIFGYDIESVMATKIGKRQCGVVAKYSDKIVHMCFNDGDRYYITINAEKSYNCEADICIIYKLGFDKFVEMIKTKRMPLSFDKLVKPVYVIKAMEKSINEKREVTLEEVY